MNKVHVVASIRSDAVLTTGYVYTSPFECEAFDTIVLDVMLQMGSLTTAEIVIEFSQDASGSNWFQQAYVADPSDGYRAVSFTPLQFSTGGNFSIPFSPVHKYFRIGVKGTGTTTDSLLGIDATFIAS